MRKYSLKEILIPVKKPVTLGNWMGTQTVVRDISSKEGGDSLPALPQGWVWSSIGEILNVVRGGSPRPKGDPRYFGGNIPWIMIADVTSEKGKFISKTRDSVTEEGATKSRYLPKGTLILTNSATVCVPKILAVDGCIHDGFVAFPDLSKNIDILYLFYYFDYIRPKIIQQNRQGVTQVNLNTEIVKNIPILLPPISEQHRIVTKIEDLFTQLDAGVASLKKVQAQLKRYRQTVLKAAFEGRLTREWREEHKGEIEPASLLLQNIIKKGILSGRDTKPINNQMMQQLPDYWTLSHLSEISEIIMGQSPPGDTYNQEGIGYPLINGPVEFGPTPFSKTVRSKFTIDPKKWCKENDLILCVRGSTTGRMNIAGFDAVIGRGVAAVRGKIDQNYLNYLVHSKENQIFQMGTGSTFPNVTVGVIGEIIVPIPPLKEQSAIVEEIERHFSQIDHLENTIITSLRQAETLRQSILKRAFEGKLVPQDPNDDPASILLERIKLEKARHFAESKKGKKVQSPSSKRRIKHAN